MNSTIKVHEFLLFMCVLHRLFIPWRTETLRSFSLNFISIHLSLPSSLGQIFSSSPCVRTPSVCVFRKCERRSFRFRIGHRIYKWLVLSVQTRVNNLLINLRDINHNVYFNTLKLGLIFSDIIHC
jgi:hypothetical protein